jgi:S-adenosyl methyltransferase
MAGRRRADGPGQTATPALVYDCLLGGKTHYDVDRKAAERLMRVKPDLQANVRANRRFLVRAVQHLPGPEGKITQFLDIGTGIPTSPNVHEVAQAAAPQCRVVYVDNDPVVLLHA